MGPTEKNQIEIFGYKEKAKLCLSEKYLSATHTQYQLVTFLVAYWPR